MSFFGFGQQTPGQPTQGLGAAPGGAPKMPGLPGAMDPKTMMMLQLASQLLKSGGQGKTTAEGLGSAGQAALNQNQQIQQQAYQNAMQRYQVENQNRQFETQQQRLKDFEKHRVDRAKAAAEIQQKQFDIQQKAQETRDRNTQKNRQQLLDMQKELRELQIKGGLGERYQPPVTDPQSGVMTQQGPGGQVRQVGGGVDPMQQLMRMLMLQQMGTGGLGGGAPQPNVFDQAADAFK